MTYRDKDENDNEEDQLGDWVAEMVGIDFKSKKEGAYPKGYYLLTEQQSGYGRPLAGSVADRTRVYVIDSGHADQGDPVATTWSPRGGHVANLN